MPSVFTFTLFTMFITCFLSSDFTWTCGCQLLARIFANRPPRSLHSAPLMLAGWGADPGEFVS